MRAPAVRLHRNTASSSAQDRCLLVRWVIHDDNLIERFQDRMEKLPNRPAQEIIELNTTFHMQPTESMVALSELAHARAVKLQGPSQYPSTCNPPRLPSTYSIGHDAALDHAGWRTRSLNLCVGNQHVRNPSHRTPCIPPEKSNYHRGVIRTARRWHNYTILDS